MEPAAAFSLACGVIQVIDFSTKLLSAGRQLHKKGSIADLEEVQAIAKHLVELGPRLKVPGSKQGQGSSSAADDALAQLAAGCSRTADDLVHRLEDLTLDKSKSKRSKREAIRKGFKAAMSEDYIATAQKTLDGYQQVLSTSILVELRYVTLIRLSGQ